MSQSLHFKYALLTITIR